MIEYLHLQDNDTHQENLSDLKEKISEGVDVNRPTAFNRVRATQKSNFDGLFQHLEKESEEEREEERELDGQTNLCR